MGHLDAQDDTFRRLYSAHFDAVLGDRLRVDGVYNLEYDAVVRPAGG